MDIGNFTEPVPEWNKAIGAKTLAELRENVKSFRRIANDAIQVIDGMTDKDFAAFKKGLYLERHGRFAGIPFAERYGAVLMPEVMFIVSMTAQEFGAPWGVAFHRLLQVGRLCERDGVVNKC